MRIFGQDVLDDLEFLDQDGQLAVDGGIQLALIKDLPGGQGKTHIQGPGQRSVPKHRPDHAGCDGSVAMQGALWRFNQAEVRETGGVGHEPGIRQEATGLVDFRGCELLKGVLRQRSQGGRLKGHGTS